MIVEVSHPSRVLHVPRRARLARVDLVATTTMAEIREIGRSEAVEVTRLKGDEVLEHGGIPWRVLKTDADGKTPATLPDLADYLAGRPVHTEAGLRQAFRRTPVKADFVTLGPAAPKPRTTRGEPLDLRSSRQVIEDGVDRARADVVAFLGSDLLVVDGAPFARLRQVARPVIGYATWRMDVATRPALDIGRRLPCRLDLAEASDAYWKGAGVEPRMPLSEDLRDAVDGIPTDLLFDDDLANLANRLPEIARLELDHSASQGRFHGDGPEAALADALAVLAPLEALGATGSIVSDAEIRDALGSTADAMSRIAGLRVDGVLSAKFGKVVAYVRDFALPNAKASVLAAEDAEAIGSLAP